MIQRYTAFLSKLWFSKADPFLKARYKDFFQESEHKWGPNMIFKNLSKNIEKIKWAKGLIEKRLNKENNYQNRISKNDNKSKRKDSNCSGKSTWDEEYEKFLKLTHKDMWKYWSSQDDHTHAHDGENYNEYLMSLDSHSIYIKTEPIQNNTLNKTLKNQILPLISSPAQPPEGNIKMLHQKLSGIVDKSRIKPRRQRQVTS